MSAYHPEPSPESQEFVYRREVLTESEGRTHRVQLVLEFSNANHVRDDNRVIAVQQRFVPNKEQPPWANYQSGRVWLTLEELRQIMALATDTLVGKVTGEQVKISTQRDQLYAQLKEVFQKLRQLGTSKVEDVQYDLQHWHVRKDFAEMVKLACLAAAIEIGDRYGLHIPSQGPPAAEQ